MNMNEEIPETHFESSSTSQHEDSSKDGSLPVSKDTSGADSSKNRVRPHSANKELPSSRPNLSDELKAEEVRAERKDPSLQEEIEAKRIAPRLTTMMGEIDERLASELQKTLEMQSLHLEDDVEDVGFESNLRASESWSSDMTDTSTLRHQISAADERRLLENSNQNLLTPEVRALLAQQRSPTYSTYISRSLETMPLSPMMQEAIEEGDEGRSSISNKPETLTEESELIVKVAIEDDDATSSAAPGRRRSSLKVPPSPMMQGAIDEEDEDVGIESITALAPAESWASVKRVAPQLTNMMGKMDERFDSELQKTLEMQSLYLEDVKDLGFESYRTSGTSESWSSDVTDTSALRHQISAADEGRLLDNSNRNLLTPDVRALLAQQRLISSSTNISRSLETLPPSSMMQEAIEEGDEGRSSISSKPETLSEESGLMVKIAIEEDDATSSAAPGRRRSSLKVPPSPMMQGAIDEEDEGGSIISSGSSSKPAALAQEFERIAEIKIEENAAASDSRTMKEAVAGDEEGAPGSSEKSAGSPVPSAARRSLAVPPTPMMQGAVDEEEDRGSASSDSSEKPTTQSQAPERDAEAEIVEDEASSDSLTATDKPNMQSAVKEDELGASGSSEKPAALLQESEDVAETAIEEEEYGSSNSQNAMGKSRVQSTVDEENEGGSISTGFESAIEESDDDEASSNSHAAANKPTVQGAVTKEEEEGSVSVGSSGKPATLSKEQESDAETASEKEGEAPSNAPDATDNIAMQNVIVAEKEWESASSGFETANEEEEEASSNSHNDTEKPAMEDAIDEDEEGASGASRKITTLPQDLEDVTEAETKEDKERLPASAGSSGKAETLPQEPEDVSEAKTEEEELADVKESRQKELASFRPSYSNSHTDNNTPTTAPLDSKLPSGPSKRPKHNRRLLIAMTFTLLIIFAILIVVLLPSISGKSIPSASKQITAGSKSSIRSRTPKSPVSRTSISDDTLYHAFEALVGDGIHTKGSSQHFAARWILARDPWRHRSTLERLEQRFLLAYFYFQTTDNCKHPWVSCNSESACSFSPATEPATARQASIGNGGHSTRKNGASWTTTTISERGSRSSTSRSRSSPSSCEFQQPIYDEYSKLSGYDTSASFRWLSGHSECSWAGIRCQHADDSLADNPVVSINLEGQLDSERVVTEIWELPSLKSLYY